jgi:hypothetical protein
MPQFDKCALVIVDVQKGSDDLSYWSPTGRRNDPARDGNARTPELTGQPYFLVTKQPHSAFYGETRPERLTPGPRDDGLRRLRNPGEPPL